MQICPSSGVCVKKKVVNVYLFFSKVCPEVRRTLGHLTLIVSVEKRVGKGEV